MQAASRAALQELAKRLSTGIVLWSGCPTPSCTCTLEACRCPDCICTGERVIREDTSWSGFLLGLTLGIIFDLLLGLRGRGGPGLEVL